MMKRYGLLLGLLVFLPGCYRYYRWAEAQFPQVTTRCDPHDINSFVRSAHAYDGFNTIGHFDALWYAPEAMALYLKEVTYRAGWSEEQQEKQWEKWRKDQLEYIIFYLLVPDLSEGGLQPQFAVDHSERALWSIVLDIDGCSYTPVGIKKISKLAPELQHAFGNYPQFHQKFDLHYRIPYRVIFPRHKAREGGPRSKDDKGIDLLDGAQRLTLYLRSVHYEVSFCWDSPQTDAMYEEVPSCIKP